MIYRLSRVVWICLGALLVVSLFVVSWGCGKSSGSAASGQAQTSSIPASSSPVADYVPPSPGAADSDIVAAGTKIEVETLETVDSDTSPAGAFIPVVLINDIKGRNGKIAVPKNSSGVVTVRSVTHSGSSSSLSLALYQITVDDKSYVVSSSGTEQNALEFREDGAKGVGHRSVHLGRRSALTFTLSRDTQFRR